MKKLFTLSLLLVLAITASAEGRMWDFTKWSAATISQIKNSTGWTNDEKGDGTTNVVPDKACVWNVNGTVATACDADGNLMAGDAVIEELKGLKWEALAAKKVAIAFDYQTTTDNNKWGPYKSGSYLWLNGKTTAVHFTIPAVEPGTVIKMGVESHKPSEGRGVDLLVAGTKIDKDPAAYPTTWAEYTWTVPGEAGGDPVNVDVQPNNGCHITYIQVGDGDAPVVEEAKKVAYLYEGDDVEDDLAYTMLSGNAALDLTGINITTNPTLESLSDYEAAIIAPSVTEANAASVVKPLIAFFPIVNLNADIIGQDGLNVGTKQQSDETSLTFVDETNAIFEGLDNPLEYYGNISTVTFFPSSKFKNDDVLAKAGTSTAIHAHKIGRNAYYFVPIDNASENAYILAANAVIAAAKTKRAIAAVGTPNITFTQADGKSTVTIAATNSEAIYYTLDGTDPTAESTKYTEPFDVTENVTVKAFATGEGYTDSEVGSKEVIIATQLAKPQIQVAREAGKSTITLTAEEGADIYFNFNGAKTAALSQKYTAPIELTEPATIYAIATKENYLPSELGKEFVGIDGVNGQNIRLDILAHMDANETDWYINNAEILPNQSGNAGGYYFWGKKAWNYYSTEVDHEEIQYDTDGITPLKSQVDPTKDSVIVYYKVNPEALKTVSPTTENGWILKSEGQVLTGELQLAPGDGVGNGATGRYAEEAIDFLPAGLDNNITKGCITFGAKTSGEPYTARIESTGKFAGPFDVVVYCGNGNSSGKGVLEIQTSTDGTTWTKLAELNLANTQRYFKRTKASYDAEEEVFVRVAQTSGGTKAQVYDIYILNSGEKSAAYSEEATGIKNVKAAKKAAGIYGINGVRRQALGRGLNIVIDEQGCAKKVVK